MLDLGTIARRFLETRRTVKQLEAQLAALSSEAAAPHPLADAIRDAFQEAHPVEQARLIAHRAALQMLAWVLEMDADHAGTGPSLRNLPEQPTRVTLHRVELGESTNGTGRRMWLVEVPAYTDPAGDAGYNTDYWACFLNDAQARELHDALSEMVLPQPIIPPTLTLGKLRRQQQQPYTASRFSIVQPDTDDGYNSVGVRRDPPPPPAANGRGAAPRPRRGA